MQVLIRLLTLLLTISIFGCTQEKDAINYFDQTPPDTTPKLFAPGVISKKDQSEFGSIISKNGTEFFFGVDVNQRSEIRMCTFENGTWSTPEVLVSHDRYSFNDPFLSPSQNELYFISDRALDGNGPKKDFDIWYIERSSAGWSEPIRQSGPINTDKHEYYISIADNGRMYFGSNIAADSNRTHDFDVYSSKLEDGVYQNAFRLGSAVNTRAYEADAFIAPDESYIIFSSVRREGQGRGDLYISFKNPDGTSSEAVNLGLKINSKNHELCPFVTPDGKYLFYTSNSDIYWVDASILTQFKS